MSFDRIPLDIREYKSFVGWRYVPRGAGAKPAKVPFSPITGEPAKVDDPTTWATYDHAISAFQTGKYDGIGFVLSNNDPYCFIDFDAPLNDEQKARHNRAHNMLDTYTEVSPSKTGRHKIALASVAAGIKREQLEIYTELRFMTMTGDIVDDANEIKDCHTAVNALWAELNGTRNVKPDAGFDAPQSVEDSLVKSRMYAAKNGEKARDLYEGRWKAHFPNSQGPSEADLGLVSIIGYYTNNREQVFRIFMASELGKREKYAKRPELVWQMVAKAFDRKLPTGDFSAIEAQLAARGDPAPVPSGERFRLLSASEVEAKPPIKWLIKGVVPAFGVVAIYGASASGKSFLAIDLACAIGGGEPWFGHVAKSAPVLYTVLEGEAGIPNRLKARRQERGSPISDNVRIMLEPFALNNPTDVATLALKCPQGSVIFVDTLNRAAPGANENDSKDMGALIDGAKMLQRITNGVVILISHTGKDADKGLRGHSSLFAALDAAIVVNRHNADSRSWEVDKAKDGADGAKHFFRLGVVEVGEDEDGDPVTSCFVALDGSPHARTFKPLSPAQNLGMATYRIAANEFGELDEDGKFVGVNVERWRDVYYRESTADNREAKKKAFGRARSDLIRIGELMVANDVYRIASSTADIENAAIAVVIAARGQGDGTGTKAGHVPPS